MRIEWLPRAECDRTDQITYIADRNPRAAIAVGDAIEAALIRLAAHPESGRAGRVDNTRELVISGTPYVLVYRLENGAVVVLRMLHGARNWPGPQA